MQFVGGCYHRASCCSRHRDVYQLNSPQMIDFKLLNRMLVPAMDIAEFPTDREQRGGAPLRCPPPRQTDSVSAHDALVDLHLRARIGGAVGGAVIVSDHHLDGLDRIRSKCDIGQNILGFQGVGGGFLFVTWLHLQ